MAINSDIETIQSDLDALKRDLSSLMSHLKIGLTEGLGGEATRLAGVVSEQSDRSLKAMQGQVRQQPLLYLAGAFVIGFLGSRVLLR